MRYSSAFSKLVKASVILLIIALAACSPAATSTPTDTAIPTNTPAPTNTPKPTNTPEPINMPRPTVTFTPALAPIILSGTGDSVVDVQKWDGPALAHITYSGSGHFAVWNYGANGEKIDLLVNTIGKYEGTLPLDFLSDEQTARFQIEGRGPWEIQVVPFEQIRRIDIPGTFDGNGDDVVYMRGTGRPDLLKIDAGQAKSNFAIWGYGNGRDLLVNEIAPYSGTVVVASSLPTSDGALVLVIKATGNWSIEVTIR